MEEVYVIMPGSYYLELLYRIEQLEKQLRLSQQQKRSKSCRSLRGKEYLKYRYFSEVSGMKQVKVVIPEPAQASLIELSEEIIAIRYGLTKNKCHERTELGNVKQVERNIKICEPSILNRSQKYNDGLMCSNVAGIVRLKGKSESK
ncbi:MAG: hypothetical protein IKJ10_03550 [Bacteroidaceae bacterium]|nr:hypothetical protein [Bacteroidaceae bacterium]